MPKYEYVADDLPSLPGTFTIRSTDWGDGVVGPHLIWRWHDEDSLCGIPLKPSPRGWDWDENEYEPTVRPSVAVSGGHVWHGFINAGSWDSE